MEVIETKIKDLLIIKPRVFADARGYFFESYNETVFKQNGINANFVQDNQSLSNTGVLRGLHFQAPPFEQGKLVRVITGAVLDVAVDIRKNSPTYGEHVAMELTEENKTMFYIPPGFAHGFLTLSEEAELLYKTDEEYSPEHDGGIFWNDPDIGIDWPNIGMKPLMSSKDQNGQRLNSAEIFS